MSKPDWDYWLSLRTVKVWEACALSMDLDPSSLTQVMWDLLGITQNPYVLTPQIPPALTGEGFPSPAVRELYYHRLRIVSSNVGDDAPIRVSHPAERAVENEILLDDFTEWVVNVAHWECPPEPILRLAHTSAIRNPRASEQETQIIESAHASESAQNASVATEGVSALHRIAPHTRTNILDDVIKTAQDAVRDPTKYQEVWATLVRMAQSDNRPAPLIGYVEAEGVKYEDERSACKFLTKNALRNRFWRRRNSVVA